MALRLLWGKAPWANTEGWAQAHNHPETARVFLKGPAEPTDTPVVGPEDWPAFKPAFPCRCADSWGRPPRLAVQVGPCTGCLA